MAEKANDQEIESSAGGASGPALATIAEDCDADKAELTNSSGAR
jgi:hypothetical protein